MTTLGGRISIESTEEERLIFDSAGTGSSGKPLGTGFTPGEGTYFCIDCGAPLALRETDTLPRCPSCGGSRFRRDSIFRALHERLGPSTLEVPLPKSGGPPEWLEEARRSLPRHGYSLVFQDEKGEIHVCPIEKGWTRIGRSSNADLFLDDPSVSRRHALVVCEPGKLPRVLDDRSLNGLLVNGRPVDWGALRDEDELTIGRYRLYLLQS